MALALRCNPKKRYSCWPSYRQLALDTGLHEVTLKAAAADLEEANLVKRVTRRNRSNIFFLNIAKLEEQADAVRKAEAEARVKRAAEEENPFGVPDFEDGTDAENSTPDQHENNASRWGGVA